MISVALCTFNGEKFIKEQLDSILTQTIVPDEIIICDDNSKDRTIEIIENYIASLNNFNIKLFKNESNIGFVKNFEKCVQLCRGEYIFLSDQDDVWISTKVEKTLSFFNSYPHIEMVFTNAYLVNEDLQTLNTNLFDTLKFNIKERTKHEFSNLFKILLKQYIITGATVCIKKKQIDFIIPIPINKYQIHDGWMGLIASFQKKLGFINECLIKYRQHPNQAIGTKKNSPSLLINKNRALFIYNIIKYADYYKTLIKSLEALFEINSLLIKTIEQKELNSKITEKNFKFLKRQNDYLKYLKKLPKNRILRLFNSIKYKRNLLPFLDSFRSRISFTLIEIIMKVDYD
ncbi:putative glycosyltransferase EpsE [Pedobacter glucosidilyticus]|nr:glycosyltransferase family 2 protein [Pedobacter glucosidilyticus]KHJ36984.1 putative glycosyltransferase EpsE [Pedobacter glucosidilyticus]